MKIHVAGHAMGVGPLQRQRCAWCPEILLEFDVRAASAPMPFDTGALVRVNDDGTHTVVGKLENLPLPTKNFCMYADAVAAGMPRS